MKYNKIKCNKIKRTLEGISVLLGFLTFLFVLGTIGDVEQDMLEFSQLFNRLFWAAPMSLVTYALYQLSKIL